MRRKKPPLKAVPTKAYNAKAEARKLLPDAINALRIALQEKPGSVASVQAAERLLKIADIDAAPDTVVNHAIQLVPIGSDNDKIVAIDAG